MQGGKEGKRNTEKYGTQMLYYKGQFTTAKQVTFALKGEKIVAYKGSVHILFIYSYKVV
jgi:hypothetical protein